LIYQSQAYWLIVIIMYQVLIWSQLNVLYVQLLRPTLST